MSIATEISRLQADKTAIANAIAAKGVTVPSGAGYDDFATLIGSISGGGGITPSGTKSIVENGIYDVTNYASADVNVPTGELPSGYTQYDYIYGDGTAYINTGVSGKVTIEIVANIDSGQTSKYLCGHGTSTGEFFGIMSTGYIGFSTNSNQYTTTSYATKHRYFINFGDNNTAFIGGDKGMFRSNTVTRSGNYGLLALRAPTTATSFMKAKIYECDIYRDGVLLFHGIPCKNSSNVAGLFDTVSESFFQSASAGQFSAGND